MCSPCRLVLACALALVCSAPGAAFAGGPEWQDEWGGIRDGEVIATFVLAATALATDVNLRPESPTWIRRLPLDERVRRLRLDTPQARRTARRTSDILFVSLVAYPFAVDSALVSGAVHRDGRLAGRLAAVNGLSFAATGALTVVAKALVRRERPFVRQCDAEPPLEPACRATNRFRSFPSGHSSMTFTAAALTCTHHQRLALYGSRAADAAACGVAVGLAGTVALLRILSDRHYLTDVLAGALIGVASGFVLPSALHYGFGD